MRTPEEIKKRIVRRKRRSREKAKQKEKEQEEAASMKYFESSSLAKEAEEKAGEDEEEFRSGIVGEVDENKALAGDELNLFSVSFLFPMLLSLPMHDKDTFIRFFVHLTKSAASLSSRIAQHQQPQIHP